MTRKTKLFILIGLTAVYLFIHPYTKEVKLFKSTDVTWALLKKKEQPKQFNFNAFKFEDKTAYRPDIAKLNGKEISVTGFITQEEHLGHRHLLLTENVTNVCAFCNHDEHYSAIVIHEDSDLIRQLPRDAFIKISGIFNYDTAQHLYYRIEHAKLDTVLILNNLNR